MKHNPSDNFIRLPFKNAENIRDLGGYPAADGKQTKFHEFLRAGELSRLEKDEIDFIIDYGLRTVIDLRGPDEIEKQPGPFKDHDIVETINVPFMEGDVTQVVKEDVTSDDPLYDMYVFFLEECADLVGRVFSAMAAAPEGAILFHCSAGKDRTGLTAAFLLSLVGVADLDIISNYAISEIYYIPYMMEHYDGELIEAYLHTKPETMEKTLAFIKENYGTPEKFLLEKAGNTKEELDALKQRLVK